MEKPLEKKSFLFAIKIVRFYKSGLAIKFGYLYCGQLYRSGTSIGALVREAEYAESRKDFVHKLSIALKEANETVYWLNLLYSSELLSNTDFHELNNDCKELTRILISSIKTAKKNMNMV